eukprot:TRINITY_DN45120_c0_g1_i1.p1 TRINITY_DN45120_c0_g1~~TRINITY_DN45120_c0_g1_i1.p1  ORF type:complete len:612 (-),score=144.86 TRINITY_DN45120_c0_g1_i1:118-1953(-)
MVLCCICGVTITGPSAGARCAQCLSKEVDIAQGVSRKVHILRCGTCQRFQKPPWTHCDMESRELLALCLKHVKGLSREHYVVDASFIYTEPHSKELKVKLVLQREAMAGVVLQQTVVVDYRIDNAQCPDCRQSFTPHKWEGCVQVRQRTGQRRTLSHLEQLILQHGAHKHVLGLDSTKDGVDFLFKRHSDAIAFSTFVKTWVVVKHHDSKKLVSHNVSNTTYKFKRTICLELCPVCRDDLVLLPLKLAQSLGGLPQLMLCSRTAASLTLVDPATSRTVEINGQEYWKRPFEAVCTPARLKEFVVLDVILDDPSSGNGRYNAQVDGSVKRRIVPCEIEVARVADFGQNDERITVRSHLGALLHPGDVALGYDLRTSNVGLDEEIVPPLEVYLVRKLQKKDKTMARRRPKGERNVARVGMGGGADVKEQKEEEEEAQREAQADAVPEADEAIAEEEDEEEDPEEAAEIQQAAAKLLSALEGTDKVAGPVPPSDLAAVEEDEELPGEERESGAVGPDEPAVDADADSAAAAAAAAEDEEDGGGQNEVHTSNGSRRSQGRTLNGGRGAAPNGRPTTGGGRGAAGGGGYAAGRTRGVKGRSRRQKDEDDGIPDFTR